MKACKTSFKYLGKAIKQCATISVKKIGKSINTHRVDVLILTNICCGRLQKKRKKPPILFIPEWMPFCNVILKLFPDFPGGPVVKYLPAADSIPGPRRFHALWGN